MQGSDGAQMDGSFAGRRILFFAVRFFGYEQAIIAELRRRGATVDYLPDRPFNSPFMTAVTRYSRAVVMPAAHRFYRQKLREFGDQEYDDVFVVNGQTMPKALLAELRSQMPRARFLFYIWDSMHNKPKAPEILPYFDECVTFDPEASRQYGMRLRPLFFSPGFELSAPSDYEYDLSFIGTAHSDRRNIVSGLDSQLGTDVSRFWYLYLQAPWVFRAHKLINPAFKHARSSDFRYVPMPRDEVQHVFRHSRGIVDIEHPRQTGLTMRTFEALGARKKLVTTNAGVRDYPFYDPQNIHVIDRSNPTLPKDFLQTPYTPVAEELYRQYSLSGWVDDLLGRNSQPEGGRQ